MQRVPPTEHKGRRHTSTIAVAILDYVNEHESKYPESEFKIDTYRASGNGGQSVNTTDSAVRITHIPTGLKACSQIKSQNRNKDLAMAVLLGRLKAIESSSLHADQNNARRGQIGSMGRGGAFVRNYNFIDGRVTDKRVNGNFKVNKIMSGNLGLIYNK